jgi:hypothetical protein
VGPTCQTPRTAPGPPGSTSFSHGCHALRRSSTLKALSGPRAGVSTAPFRPRRCHCPNRLASPVPTTSSPRLKPTVAVREPRPPLSGRLRHHEHVHGERRPSFPLAVLRPWSIELTFPSLLAVAGPPSTTVAPTRQKNTAINSSPMPGG